LEYISKYAIIPSFPVYQKEQDSGERPLNLYIYALILSAVEQGLDLTNWHDLVILILFVLLFAGPAFLLIQGLRRRPPSGPDGK
jgi:hypothetical protein